MQPFFHSGRKNSNHTLMPIFIKETHPKGQADFVIKIQCVQARQSLVMHLSFNFASLLVKLGELLGHLHC